MLHHSTNAVWINYQTFLANEIDLKWLQSLTQNEQYAYA